MRIPYTVYRIPYLVSGCTEIPRGHLGPGQSGAGAIPHSCGQVWRPIGPLDPHSQIKDFLFRRGANLTHWGIWAPISLDFVVVFGFRPLWARGVCGAHHKSLLPGQQPNRALDHKPWKGFPALLWDADRPFRTARHP
jgi:hypothetical protein